MEKCVSCYPPPTLYLAYPVGIGNPFTFINIGFTFAIETFQEYQRFVEIHVTMNFLSTSNIILCAVGVGHVRFRNKDVFAGGLAMWVQLVGCSSMIFFGK